MSRDKLSTAAILVCMVAAVSTLPAMMIVGGLQPPTVVNYYYTTNPTNTTNTTATAAPNAPATVIGEAMRKRGITVQTAAPILKPGGLLGTLTSRNGTPTLSPPKHVDLKSALDTVATERDEVCANPECGHPKSQHSSIGCWAFGWICTCAEFKVKKPVVAPQMESEKP